MEKSTTMLLWPVAGLRETSHRLQRLTGRKRQDCMHRVVEVGGDHLRERPFSARDHRSEIDCLQARDRNFSDRGGACHCSQSVAMYEPVVFVVEKEVPFSSRTCVSSCHLPSLRPRSRVPFFTSFLPSFFFPLTLTSDVSHFDGICSSFE